MTRARQLCPAASAALLAACSLFPTQRPTPPRPIDDAAPGREAAGAGAGIEGRSLEEEEAILEGIDGTPAADGDPIGTLIAALAAPRDGAARPEGAPSPGRPHDDVDTGAGGAETAYDVWSMTDDACLEALSAAGIAVSRPDFDTPFVGQPLLLDGPIDGVAIRPRWRRAIRVNEVMDCRLIAALRGAARAARELGFSEILFYSTYRPTRDKAKAGKASMHRRGLAVDVGWLTTAEGAEVEVLERYELHAGEPPCDTPADTDVGRRLRDLACALHARKIFNVVLTPNANAAHRNHFHFDVTPNARWYIIR